MFIPLQIYKMFQISSTVPVSHLLEKYIFNDEILRLLYTASCPIRRDCGIFINFSLQINGNKQKKLLKYSTLILNHV